MNEEICDHVRAITTVKHSKRQVCEECVKIYPDNAFAEY